MQTTHKIAGSSAGGYAAYLASSSDRGDYYTAGEGGEGGVVMAASRWHGSPELLAGLGLSPGGEVGCGELAALMAGVSPVDGSELRRAGGDGSRVAGIDVTFSAPKSVSALWAVSSSYDRARIEAAHGRAVAGTIGRIEREVELVRTRVEGRLVWVRAERLLAAEFVHTSSRLTRDQERGGVPDPQLHSHVVVLGAQRADGRFVAVDSRELFRSARANGAWYRAELSYHLGELGLEVRGRTGRDGRYFELAGVPAALAERWSARSADIERAARAFRTRYGRDPRAGELGALTTRTRGTKSTSARVSVDGSWRAVGEEYGLTRERARGLFAGEQTIRSTAETQRELGRELLREVTRDRSVVSDRDLHARAYELSAGVCRPCEADRLLVGLARSGELVALQDGLWTTRELRERERQTLTLTASRAREPAAPIDPQTLREARLGVQREIGAPLSTEQRQALERITGPGGVSVLVGQAGTGKGVVIATAVRAWQQEGYEVVGTAVAGAMAERLGADANLTRSVTTDALLHREQNGQITLGERTVVVMDEAGMADTKRLAALTELTARRESKLVLVGDQAQLSPIGAGGMFKVIQDHVPTAHLTEVHRARHAWERQAWAQVREGEAQRALAGYEAHERLHITDTRTEAAERMIDAWEQARRENPEQRTVMLTDASNVELDRINALAQERRAQAGELGAHHIDLPDKPYGLAAGDEIIFTAPMRAPGQQRVENGTTATITSTAGEDQLTVETQGADPREVTLNTGEFSELRLAYAQHVYKAQGRTVDQAFVLTGGWQTDREHAYVALTRARERTDIYASREDLGEQGMDPGAIERLAENINHSDAQRASIDVGLEPGTTPGIESDPSTGRAVEPERSGRESEAAQMIHESQQEQDRDQDLGFGIV